MKTSPCKDCKNRHIGCHSTCDNYRGWKAEHELSKEKERQEKNGYTVSCGGWIFTLEGYWRNYKIPRRR